MSKYPAQIDNDATLPKVTDNFSPVTGDSVNRLRSAIIAIENELGIKPASLYTTVRGRLDNLENILNSLNFVQLGGDIGGTLLDPVVVGIQGNPVSSIDPEIGEFLTWNGLAWVPSNPEVSGDLDGYSLSPTVVGLQGLPVADTIPTFSQVLTWTGASWGPETLENIVFNVLPTSITLPLDVTFVSGDGYANNSSPTRIGARVVDMSKYPYAYLDGRIRTMYFTAELEVSGTGIDGYVQLKDVTNNVIITNTLLTTNSLSSTQLSVELFSGTTDGYMRTDVNAMYEVQIYKMGGGSGDYCICRNARIEFTYGPPLEITTIGPIALPIDLQFVSGVVLSSFGTPVAVGGRSINMIPFPNQFIDGRVRTATFYADVEVSAPGVDGYIQLYDNTHNVVVTNTNFHFTNTLNTELSATLTVGFASGNLRNDVTTSYEVQIWKISGSVADRVICTNARVTITYA